MLPKYRSQRKVCRRTSFVSCSKSDEENDIESKSIESFQKCAKVENLQSIHDSIDFAKRPLKKVLKRGLIVHKQRGKPFQLHLLIALYFANIPKAKDLLRVKRGARIY